jgi:serine protease Do
MTDNNKFVSKIKINDRSLIIFALLTFLIGVSGGLIGGYAYLDYKGYGIFSNAIGGSFSNLKVQENSAVIDVAKKDSPAVVSITGIQETLDFFGNVDQSKSSGTGFIVTKDGLIATNKHVVADKNAKYSVFTNDGKEYQAEVKAVDSLNDLAFVKINASNLPVMELGNSDDIQVGQRVVAIGNALGQYQNTVTAGVISAIGRAIEAGDSSSGSSESLENVIQTDAAINPGNSGGPLVNLTGQAIGMNTAIDQQGQAIGFALPINVVKSGLESVLLKGKIIRPMLGVRYIPITKEFATRNDLTVNEGAYIYGGRNVAAVAIGSPAAQAGLKEGDIITKLGADKINAQHSLSGLLSKYRAGDKVGLTYLRDGKEKSIQITLSESKS